MQKRPAASIIRILVFLAAFICLFSCQPPRTHPEAVDGLLDLTDYPLNQQIIPLSGYWDFYWDELLTPSTLDTSSSEVYRAPVPSSWMDYQLDSQQLPVFGSATYRLKINLPDTKDTLGLYIPKVWCATRVFINRKLAINRGQPNREMANFEGKMLEALVQLPPNATAVDLVVQVSNQHLFLAGLVEPLTLGRFEQLKDLQLLKSAFALVWLGALVAMAIYHFMLFFYRRTYTPAVFFGVICLLLAIRITIFGEHELYDFLQHQSAFLSLNGQYKIYYLSSFLLVPFAISYVGQLYPAIAKKPFFRRINGLHFKNIGVFFSILILPYCLFLAFAPVAISSLTVPVAIVVLVALPLLVLLLILFRSIYHQTIGHRLQLTGIAFMAIAGVNDLLLRIGELPYQSFDLLPLAFALFLFLQFGIIARYTNQFAKKQMKTATENSKKTTANKQEASTSIAVNARENTENLLLGYNQQATRLQKITLQPPEILNNHFKEIFVYERPKVEVSGDFFWFTEVALSAVSTQHKKRIKLLVIADSAGHGLQAAVSSAEIAQLLSTIIKDNFLLEPSLILYELDEKIHSKYPKSSIEDKLRIGVMAIDENRQKIQFAGAGLPLWCVKDGKTTEISELPAGKHTVGGAVVESKNFRSYSLGYQAGDAFYLFTDGFQCQLGGAHYRKFSRKRLKQEILKVSTLPLSEQKKALIQTLANWQGEKPTTDDLLMIGLRF